MHRNAKIVLTLILLALVFIGGIIWIRSKNNTSDVDSNISTNTDVDNNTGNSITAEEFIKENISSLSKEAGVSETVGGKFFVTKIESKDGKGTVNYEDGHNAYVADFTYVTEKGNELVTTFKIRK